MGTSRVAVRIAIGAALATAALAPLAATPGTAAAAEPRRHHGAASSGERTYTVQGNVLRGAAPAAHRRLWNRFATLIPVAERRDLARFAVFTDPFADAFVEPLKNDPDRWSLGVYSRIPRRELDFTLVHEFGHLLTLRSTQVPPGPVRPCATFDTGDGCADPTSYIARFVKAHWKRGGLFAQWRRVDRLTGDRKDDAIYRLYLRHRTKFVTDYAATSPSEDIAESFAAYVFNRRARKGSVAAGKIRFFAAYPELVALKATIRSRMKLTAPPQPPPPPARTPDPDVGPDECAEFGLELEDCV